jgi:cyanate permease
MKRSSPAEPAHLLDLLVTLFTGQLSANLRGFARKAAFAAVVFVFALIALSAGAAALFLALDAAVGALKAALIVAAAAAVLAALASIPLWRRPEPPPSATATLVQLALAVGLGLLAARKDKPDAPPRA